MKFREVRDEDGTFHIIDGKWYWIDLDNAKVGPFSSREKANSDAVAG